MTVSCHNDTSGPRATRPPPLVTLTVLFVPVAKGTDDVKAMFVLLTGIAVRDYFASRDRQAERDRADPEAKAAPAV